MGCVTAKNYLGLNEAVKREQSNSTVYGTIGGHESNNKQSEIRASAKTDSSGPNGVENVATSGRQQPQLPAQARSYLLSDAMSYNNIDTSLNDMSTIGAPVVPLFEDKEFKNKKVCHSKRKLSISLSRNNMKPKKSGKSRRGTRATAKQNSKLN